MTHKYSHPNSAPSCLWGSRYSIGLALVGSIAAFFLLSEHRPHVLSAVPLLLLVMFSILLAMVARLSVNEEATMRERFGSEFDACAKATRRIVPRLSRAGHSYLPSNQSVEDHP